MNKRRRKKLIKKHFDFILQPAFIDAYLAFLDSSPFLDYVLGNANVPKTDAELKGTP